jgi:hypothetical protein
VDQITDPPPNEKRNRGWSLFFVSGALAAFVVLCAFQTYCAIGKSLITDIANSREQIGKLETDYVSKDLKPEIAAPDDLVSAVSYLNSYHDSLEDWLSPFEPLLEWASLYKADPEVAPNPTKAEEKERPVYTEAQRQLCVSAHMRPDDKSDCPPTLKTVRAVRNKVDTFTEEDLITAHYVVDWLEEFLLPFPYGLLGAFVYVLRQLSNEKMPTPPLQSGHQQFIRLAIGALAGVAIAWVSTPYAERGLMKSIQPFVLAFVAGYSVEVLFVALDRLVAAFTEK